ncbi:MAG TPA: hypothetical protein VGD00_01755, partial [Solirubrobacteraceae bacterium]
NFRVLPAGRIPFNPSELLGSPAIAAIVAELAEEGAMVLIDAPPLNPVADAHVLLNNPAIRAAIVIARLGHTTRDEVARARRILDHHIVEPLGIVVTGVRDEGEYGYESYSGEEPTLQADLDELSARTSRSVPKRGGGSRARRRQPRQPH